MHLLLDISKYNCMFSKICMRMPFHENLFLNICNYNCKHCSSNSSMKPFKCTELIDARTSIKKSVTDASPQIINKVDYVTSKLKEDVLNEIDLSKLGKSEVIIMTLGKFKCNLCTECFPRNLQSNSKGKKYIS